MPRLFDFGIIAVIAFAQWRISRMVVAWAARRLSAWERGVVHVSLAGFYAVLTVGFLLSFSQLVSLYSFPARTSGILSGAAYLWFLSSTAGYFVSLAVRLFSLRLAPGPFDPARRRLLNSAGSALVAAPFVVIGYGALVERSDFRLREIDVPLPDLPRDLEGLRLVQISDIHLSVFLSEQELARVIDAANETRAHVALVTGDLISAKGDPLDACLRQVARLRADAGILGCLGNHEVYAQAEGYATGQGARLGIRFLRNQAQSLRFGAAVLNIAGVDYQPRSMRGRYLPGAERMVAPGAVNLLLSHNPDVFPAAVKKGYNLTISGHTHGGQVTLEILQQSVNPARFFTPYVYGLYRLGPAWEYVTRGIGTIGVPARIGAPPEIALLRLTKA